MNIFLDFRLDFRKFLLTVPNSLRLTEIDNWADFADFQLLARIISVQLCKFRGSVFPKLTKISLTCK